MKIKGLSILDFLTIVAFIIFLIWYILNKAPGATNGLL